MEGFVAGMCVIVLIFFIGTGIVATKSMKHSDGLIAECEAELPRNESCVLIAVPESAAEKTNE